MKRYIALFRGINVGGRNILPMKALRALLEELGAHQVKTYIQSGNAVFRHETDDIPQLARRISAGSELANREQNYGYDQILGELMSTQIQTEHFTKAVYALLDEIFDNVHGYVLDKGTSMFETLATISAEEASVPVGGKCATLAAQVKHVAFYLDVLENAIRTQQFESQDWDKIWRETGAVTPQKWAAIKASLRESYDQIKALIDETPEWSNERQIGGIIATIVHTAYHLGEIRQALCTLKK